jgi:hypothetical protein
VLACHPYDPRLLLSAGYDGVTLLWDLEGGAALKRYVVCSAAACTAVWRRSTAGACIALFHLPSYPATTPPLATRAAGSAVLTRHRWRVAPGLGLSSSWWRVASRQTAAASPSLTWPARCAVWLVGLVRAGTSAHASSLNAAAAAAAAAAPPPNCPQFSFFSLGPPPPLLLAAPYDQFLARDFAPITHCAAGFAAYVDPSTGVTLAPVWQAAVDGAAQQRKQLLCDVHMKPYPEGFQDAYRAGRVLEFVRAGARGCAVRR